MEFRADTICLEGDSNAIILAAKRNGKNKAGNKDGMKANSTPKLSKSQKRKLKKLEEKLRELLLLKSIKTLEYKFKIPESAFSLLQKRRMAVQMSKAGLDEIMEAVNEDSTIIICGETGCGKTTQVPQFLYEAGFGSYKCSSRSGVIGVTQPRHIAVLAIAKRVAFELGFHLGKEVGFQVRHDKKVGDGCSIKFMTDRILLREVQNDILLRQYSVIILDEAHERSLNTDILIGMLSRVICLRQKTYKGRQKMILSGKHIDPKGMIFPLKLILMSATLRVEDFVSGRKLFQSPPPIIEVPRRQFPVTLHFSKRTDIVDYIGQAYKKGGILVFVTGQREVEYLCQKLRKASRKLTGNLAEDNKGGVVADIMNSIQDIDMKDIDEAFEIQGNFTDLKANGFSSYDANVHNFSDDESVCLVGEEGDLTSLKATFEALAGKPSEDSKCEGKGHSLGAMHVLPLYAMLPPATQLRVFEKVNEGERLVIVATNVAETYLTIPGIKYVVDTGREKVKNYNPSNGMETYEVQWISKAFAAQRAGRAGRTGLGHCYRLYSSAIFNNILPDFSCPEICKVPIESIVLILKSMSIDKFFFCFPFPTPHEANALVEARGRPTIMRANLVLGYLCCGNCTLSLPNPFIMRFERSHYDGEKKLKESSKGSLQDFLILAMMHLRWLMLCNRDFSWNHGKVVDIELAWNVSSGKNPLFLNEEQILGRAICLWVVIGLLSVPSCMIKEVVFLHRRSSLSSSSPSFGRTLNLIMNVILTKYFLWVVPTFGHLWHLPLRSRPIFGLANRVKVFAYALLDGQILPCLRSVKKFMAARPTIILDREATGKEHCAMLREVWNYNPMELYSKLRIWFKRVLRKIFKIFGTDLNRNTIRASRTLSQEG
ncbi:hypothetical protein K2173_023286 [Erythroxylum novogranatense]|uniref:RNA helicase n=1 Tax=Erythroxylum novogranatense TaxID=1862640 RepID=A0AAV8T9W5_9ROSI|nr:hypothetical protein K2173_023286 [Erythroxylum novogranatense]